jgi:hypothetical protein
MQETCGIGGSHRHVVRGIAAQPQPGTALLRGPRGILADGRLHFIMGSIWLCLERLGRGAIITIPYQRACCGMVGWRPPWQQRLDLVLLVRQRHQAIFPPFAPEVYYRRSFRTVPASMPQRWFMQTLAL